ncbi:aminoglycoside phosphotransferase family protein [Actinomycetospora termitidis]|uniref:Aminoglycoside phosphotransferase family protein n=1 Tax=Actinomycetospora termitidis TaxID=3053470 RepID=A0ABT7MAZ0_9PSEU|nr:aminoglycoside phosphotransferase family protein [Actinomycetospora sp. Odt1-22]MDL5157364.1 aminoglycoside phosphotransferase family protein [Actinomycetospora sp. Odt1-22]
MVEVPDEARRRLVARFGPEVSGWLDDVPGRVARLAHRWGLALDGTVLSGNSALVLPADRGVLKLHPDPTIAATEAAALEHWAGAPHVVDLLAHDDGALLLDRLRPGTALPAGTGVPALLPAVRDLWTADPVAPPDLPPLADRVAFWLGRVREQVVDDARVRARMPLEALDRGHAAATALAARPGHHGVVHGDLHPANVLAGPAGPVVIDPRPHVGDRTFDLVDLVLVDPPGRDAAVAALARALDGLDADLLHAWCRALAPATAVAALRTAPDAPRTAALVRSVQHPG